MFGDPQPAGKHARGQKGEADARLPGRCHGLCRRKPGGQIKHQHQTTQDHAHQQAGALCRPRAPQPPGQQGQQDGKGVADQQCQGHRNPRHGRIQAQALGCDQQTQHDLPFEQAGRKAQARLTPQDERRQRQQRQPRTADNGQQQAGLIIEGEAGCHVIGGEQRAHEQEGCHGNMPWQDSNGRHADKLQETIRTTTDRAATWRSPAHR